MTRTRTGSDTASADDVASSSASGSHTAAALTPAGVLGTFTEHPRHLAEKSSNSLTSGHLPPGLFRSPPSEK